MPRRTALKRHTFRTAPGNPDLVEAASVVLGVLGLVKHRSLASLAEAVAAEDRATCDLLAGVVLPERVELLLADPDVVSVMERLRAKINRDSRVRVCTLIQCSACGGWTITGGSGAPARCALTRDCPGRPIRAVVATRQLLDPDPDPDPAIEGTVLEQADLAAEHYEQPSADAEADAGFANELGHRPAQLEQHQRAESGAGAAVFETAGPEDDDQDPFG